MGRFQRGQSEDRPYQRGVPMFWRSELLKGRSSQSIWPSFTLRRGRWFSLQPSHPSNTVAFEEKTLDLQRLSLYGGHTAPPLALPLRFPSTPPRTEGRAGADSVSHVLGLELRREAPPLLGPLLSPSFLPAGPGPARNYAAITDSPSPIRLGKGPRGGAAQHRDAGQSNLGDPDQEVPA